MYSFFVLGLIPGTNIQITFTMWLNAFVTLLAAIIIYSFIKKLQNEATAAAAPLRSPLYAQQLHVRGI